MMRMISLCCLMLAASVHAEEIRVYQTDAFGRGQSHKPSFTVQSDGRIIETSPYGAKQYHKQQYVMKDGKVYPVGSSGRLQYDKPRLVVEK